MSRSWRALQRCGAASAVAARGRDGRHSRRTCARSGTHALERQTTHDKDRRAGDAEKKKNAFMPVGRRDRGDHAVRCRRDRDAPQAQRQDRQVDAGPHTHPARCDDLIDTGKEAARHRAAALQRTRRVGHARQAQVARDAPARIERLIEGSRRTTAATFLTTGGGDSADTCFKVSQLSRRCTRCRRSTC